MALNLLGAISAQEGDGAQGLELIRKAVALRPDFAEAHSNLGIVLKDQGSLEAAVAAYLKALALKPGLAQAHYNLGIALKALGRLEEAVAAYRQALRLKPESAQAHYNLGNALKDQGRAVEAVAAYRTALKLRPDHTKAHSNLLLSMNYDGRFPQEDILAESRRWSDAQIAVRRAQQRPLRNDRDPERPLRVGYVSPDFREHPVSYFIEPLLAGHDRGAFSVFCYAEVAKPDDKTARFRALADTWCATADLTDAALAERIRGDEIDILVDLAGHTDKSRLAVFAERPAPVQATWLGYPNTTGLPAMDYRLTDAIADPEGAADSLHSETLVRLPGGFLCFAAPSAAGPPDAPPASRRGHVSFGSFNNLAKVTPEVVETWAAILDRLPGSRLMLKCRQLIDEGTQARYFALFRAQGIAAERIEMCPWILSKSGHLGAYGQIDVGLDPFPYNGTTTTCEALWMGVPVITLRGLRHSGRVGASLLTRVGLEDLIAETKESYVETAVGLAGDPERRSDLRDSLRRRMQASPLCDGEAFSGNVEAAYRWMWRRWVQG